MSHSTGAKPRGAEPRNTSAKLVYMANQIGAFFRSQGSDAAVKGTAEHIKKFWDPRMRKAIFAHLDAGGDGLDPAVRRAIEQLKGTAIEA
jgi:formate dehydrogenase subunit delta